MISFLNNFSFNWILFSRSLFYLWYQVLIKDMLGIAFILLRISKIELFQLIFLICVKVVIFCSYESKEYK